MATMILPPRRRLGRKLLSVAIGGASLGMVACGEPTGCSLGVCDAGIGTDTFSGIGDSDAGADAGERDASMPGDSGQDAGTPFGVIAHLDAGEDAG